MTNKSIMLLSGGLDSLVSLGIAKERYNIICALTFDYGQKAASKEIKASKKICDYYNISHEVIKLDWLAEITKTSLVADIEIPTNEISQDSRNSVWVPNRNGLFLNIAACYAESYNFENIIIGANKEEAKNFPDNTPEFINAVNEEFKLSTLKRPKVVAPLINYNKNDIVMLALDNKIPLELTMSCYQGKSGHCGICESCIRLKRALKENNDTYYTKVLFG